MTSGRIEFPTLTHFKCWLFFSEVQHIRSDRVSFFTRSACMPKPASGLPVVSKTTTWRTVKAGFLNLSFSLLPLPGDVRQPSYSLAGRWCSPQTTGPVLSSTTSSILFEHRGEGTNLEFGKLSVVPISQRHRTGGLWRTRKTFGASSRNENAFL